MLFGEDGLYFGDVSAAQIAELHGTPVYVIDAEAIERRLVSLRQAITHRPLRILYACKAYANVAVLRYMRSLGVGLDACSPGDLAFAEAAGFTPEEVSYTGVSLKDDELRLVAEKHVHFQCGSLSQLERFGRIAPGRSIGLRINCGTVPSAHDHVQRAASFSKFGVLFEELEEARRIASHWHLRLEAVHAHVGSDISEVEPMLGALDRLVAAANALPDVVTVDVGCGWTVPQNPEDPDFDMLHYGVEVSKRMAALARLRGRSVELVLEPGAYLISEAGILLTRVCEVRSSVEPGDGGSPAVAYVDTNSNHVMTAGLFGAYHPIWHAERPRALAVERYNVAGNLMQASDLLAEARPLPRLREGDLLAIGNCGAYAASRASTFNERPRPPEVLVDRGGFRLVRRAETVTELLSHQIGTPDSS